MSVLSLADSSEVQLPGYLHPVRLLNYADDSYGTVVRTTTTPSTPGSTSGKKRTRKGARRDEVPLMYNRVFTELAAASTQHHIAYPFGGAPSSPPPVEAGGFSWVRDEATVDQAAASLDGL